jgi:hypothetical protein
MNTTEVLPSQPSIPSIDHSNLLESSEDLEIIGSKAMILEEVLKR